MKTLSTLPLLGLLGAAFGGLAFVSANSLAQDGADAKQEANDDHDNALHESMEVLQQNMRAMRKLMTDPSMKEEALTACTRMEESIIVALQHAPEPQDGLVEQTALEWEVGFKRRMLAVYGTVLDLEVALEKGDGDAAKAAYRALGAEKKEGHDIYLPEEDGGR